jgi:hypothetical protein
MWVWFEAEEPGNTMETILGTIGRAECFGEKKKG